MVHAGLESYLQGIDPTPAMDARWDEVDLTVYDQKALDELKKECILAYGMLEAYAAKYPEDPTRFKKLLTEKEIKLVIQREPKIRYSATLDLLCQEKDGSWWVYDHKTASSLDDGYLLQARVASQTWGYVVAAYHLLGEWPKGIVYNVLLKPGIRQRTKRDPETKDQFLKRLYAELVNDPNKKGYFHREEILFDRRLVSEWQVETRHYASQLYADWAAAQADGGHIHRFPKNTGSCSRYRRSCGYLPICSGGSVSKTLYEKKDPYKKLV